MKKILRYFFDWLFKAELKEINDKISKLNKLSSQLDEREKEFKNLLGNSDLSIDVHQGSRSWAVISLQGDKTDFIKFMDLGNRDIQYISEFLSQFERSKMNVKIDAPRSTRGYLRANSRGRF